ncbi:MAG: ATP-dependent helicase, partial [Planctomycetota bacterium]
MCSKPASPGYLRQPDKPSKTQSAASSDTHSEQPRRTIAPQNLVVPSDLPIAAHADDIIAKLRDHQVLVVSGETGSGKSTQLPKFCIEAGLGIERMIGHTQPRRLAARSIASRLAEEMETSVGDRVGYKVRFGDQTSGRTN